MRARRAASRASPCRRAAATLAHQPMQPDRVGRDRRIALVRDRLAVDEREGAQRRDRLVEAVAGEQRRERLAELFARLGEQEQRDRLGREQRGMDDQRLGGGMELRGLVDGEREGLRDRQAVVILGRRVLARRRAAAPARPSKRLRYSASEISEPLAIGRRLLVRERQAAERLRQRLGLGALAARGRCGRSDSRRRSPSARADFDRRRRSPRQACAFEVTSTRAAPPGGR